MREIVFSRIGCGDLVFPRERKGWREDECSELRPSASFSAVIRRSSRRSHLTASYLCLASADCRRALTAHGQVRLTLKTPYREGTTHVIFEPEDFIAGWRLWCLSRERI